MIPIKIAIENEFIGSKTKKKFRIRSVVDRSTHFLDCRLLDYGFLSRLFGLTLLLKYDK